MTEAFQYSIGDFLLFSEDTYLELLRYYHLAIWPLQIVALALAFYSLVTLFRGGLNAVRIVATLFSAGWIWTGLVFLGSYYADINWFVNFFVVLFGIQGVLLFWMLWWPFGITKPVYLSTHELCALARNKSRELSSNRNACLVRSAGLMVIASASLIFPLLLKVQRRSWDQLEVVFITPDATSFATIGLLLCLKNFLGNKTLCLLAVIPLLWSLFSLLTWWSIESAGY